jgi:hypothetical protein
MSVFESLTDSQRHSLNDLIHREAVKRVSQSQWQSKRRMAVDSFRDSQGLRTGLTFFAKLDKQFVADAYHESGHAVTGSTLGFQINKIEIGNDIGSTLDFTPPKLAADGIDTRKVTMVVSGWLSERLAKLTNAKFDAPEYLVDNAAMVREQERLGLDQKQFDGVFKNCCYSAIDILQRKWGAVDRLAQKIIEYRGVPLYANEIRATLWR